MCNVRLSVPRDVFIVRHEVHLNCLERLLVTELGTIVDELFAIFRSAVAGAWLRACCQCAAELLNMVYIGVSRSSFGGVSSFCDRSTKAARGGFVWDAACCLSLRSLRRIWNGTNTFFPFLYLRFHLDDKSVDDCWTWVCFGCRCSGSFGVVYHKLVGLWGLYGFNYKDIVLDLRDRYYMLCDFGQMRFGNDEGIVFVEYGCM